MEEYPHSQYWRLGPLRKFSQEVLEAAPLPDETKAYLRDYGLPEQYTVCPPPAEVVSVLLPETDHTMKKLRILSYVAERWLAFAESVRSPSYGVPLEDTMSKVLECFEVESGKVYVGIYEDNKLHRIGITNNSVWQYAQSLAEYSRVMENVSNGASTDLALERFERALTAIDPEAMRDFDGRWQEELRLLQVII